MRARAALLDTLSVLHGCMSDDALMDSVPGATDHNRCAAMLRQGLAVLTFTAIETFVRDRTTEAMRSFNNSAVSFSDLSAALQKAATIGALEGIRFRLKFQEKADQVSWLVAQLPCIANVGTDIANLSDMSFGQQSSNIDEDDIRDVLAAFGVDSPWTNILLSQQNKTCLNRLTPRIEHVAL